MALISGTRLGPYEILAPIGKSWCFRHRLLLRRDGHLNARVRCLPTSATEGDHVVLY